jgi:hypothetical protein
MDKATVLRPTCQSTTYHCSLGVTAGSEPHATTVSLSPSRSVSRTAAPFADFLAMDIPRPELSRPVPSFSPMSHTDTVLWPIDCPCLALSEQFFVPRATAPSPSFEN